MGEYLFVFSVGLAAGAVSGVIGTGSSIMLLPVLVFTFGPKQAVPIMAVAAVMANISRVVAWWREINWKAFAAYSITGVPSAAMGAHTLWKLPVQMIDIGLGIFFLVMLPFRHWLEAKKIHISLWQLSIAGGFIGYLTGIVLSTGPLSVPAFTSYGLIKGAFLSTEAASSLVIYIGKIVTFQELGALPIEIILQGVLIGISLMFGTFVAKRVVQRMNIVSFRYVLDALLMCSGFTMLWNAYTQ